MTTAESATTQLPAPAPVILPEVKVFWDAAAEGKLLLPHCKDCQSYVWYPRPFCPECGSLNIEWVQASGKGTVYSFTVNRRGTADVPEFRTVTTYVLAYVQLEEGPRMLTNIVDCDPDSVRIGQPMQLVFHPTPNGTALPRFRPA